ncbi:MAG: T9SS type A sorting domain-containing protein [Candidatus Cloacimonetes bacterium]|nr:T9SS type A sorting domain-containing protein [Candidatus Cloacimonadota bacterium]
MKNLIFIFILIFCSTFLFSQTTIPGGPVWGTWDLAGSPYLIEGDIVILLDTLIIEPGVTVIFQDHYKFNVGIGDFEGQLLAIGAEQDSILFTAADPDIGWCGIRFETELSYLDSSRIKYCRIEYGKATGTGNDTKGGAIYCDLFSEVEIAYCNITNNYTEHPDGGAIYLENSEPLIHHLKIQNNENGGIFSNELCSNISESKICNNTNYGLKKFHKIINCEVFNHEYGIIYSEVIENCKIFDNDYGIIDILGETNDQIIINSFISNNEYAMNYDNGWSTGNYELVGCVITNNDHGLFSSCGFDMSVVNCTFAYNDDYGIHIWEYQSQQPRSNVSILNTIFFMNEDNIEIELFPRLSVSVDYSLINDAPTGVNIGDNCITGNPDFVDPSSGVGSNYNGLIADWSLDNTSICINQGIPDTTGLNIPELDIAGNPRIYQGDIPRIDIGAYEFQGEPQIGIDNFQLPVVNFQLSNYPNPFNPETKISFSIAGSDDREKNVSITIYNIKGQRVKKLVKEKMKLGRYFIIWNSKDQNGKPVSSGIYFYQLDVEGKTRKTCKMLLLK